MKFTAEFTVHDVPLRDGETSTGASGEQGFTLIEITIALLIMMVVSLGAAALFAYSITYNTGGSDRALAAAVAQHELEKTRNVAFAGLAGLAGSSTVKSGGRNYNVTRTISTTNTTACPACSASLVGITITVTPQNATGWAGTPVSVTTRRSALTKGTNS